MAQGDKRIIFGVEVTEGADGLYRDQLGTVYGLTESKGSADETIRCGVGVASLPASNPWTDACRAHDNSYQNPAYQTFHTRGEADAKLEADLKLLSTSRLRRYLAPVVAGLARVFGRFFWENPKTR